MLVGLPISLSRMNEYRFGGEALFDSSNLVFFSGTTIVLKGSFIGLSWKSTSPASFGLVYRDEAYLADCLYRCLFIPVIFP